MAYLWSKSPGYTDQISSERECTAYTDEVIGDDYCKSITCEFEFHHWTNHTQHGWTLNTFEKKLSVISLWLPTYCNHTQVNDNPHLW